MTKQFEMISCGYCHALFMPKRHRQLFCKPKCQSSYDIDVGLEGRISGVRRLKSGQVSVTTYYAKGAAAERAILLLSGLVTRTMKAPT